MVLLNVDMFPVNQVKASLPRWLHCNYIQQNPGVRSPEVLVRKTESPCLHCTNILKMRLYLFKCDWCEVIPFHASVEVPFVNVPIVEYLMTMQMAVDVSKIMTRQT